VILSPPTLLELDLARKPKGLRAFFFPPPLFFALILIRSEIFLEIKDLPPLLPTFPQD